MTRLLRAHEVAALFAWSPRRFRERRGELEAAGFPEPVDPPGNRWDPVAIDRWLARRRGEPAADWQAELEARLEAQ